MCSDFIQWPVEFMITCNIPTDSIVKLETLSILPNVRTAMISLVTTHMEGRRFNTSKKRANGHRACYASDDVETIEKSALAEHCYYKHGT